MGIKILVVEDDEHIGNTVKTFLQSEGYIVDLCADGNEAVDKLYDNNYQLAVLDIMLLGMSGHEILRELALISSNITNNLFIMPKNQTPKGVAADMIEEINEDKFIVSYLSVSSAAAKVMDSSYDVVLKGTNYTFPYAMNYSIAGGGFFSQKMQENKSRSAVLNEKAAFDMFGGNNISGRELSIGGMNYVVTGVIRDNDDEAYNIYIPITLMSKNPSEFIAPLGMEISPEYVKNELKYIGINDDKYSFIDCGLLKEIITDKFLAALEILLLGLLIDSLFFYNINNNAHKIVILLPIKKLDK